MIADYPDAPPRLAPFLAQWDYMSDQVLARLEGLTDDELLWEPARAVLTVRGLPDGSTRRDARGLPPTADAVLPRTLAWSIGHLGAGCLVPADWLVGWHSVNDDDLDWPMTATEAIAFLRDGLAAWRDGVGTMTDADLDTVGRSAYPHGRPAAAAARHRVVGDKELLEHAAAIWDVRDRYA